MPDEEEMYELERALGISALDADAAHMHEVFTSLTRAGFNERQALILVSLFGSPDPDMVVLTYDDNEGGDDDD